MREEIKAVEGLRKAAEQLQEANRPIKGGARIISTENAAVQKTSYTAAFSVLFTEQVPVCSGASQGQHQYIILNAVNQQPIREDMTLTVSRPIPGQSVISVLFRERFAHCKSSNHIL